MDWQQEFHRQPVTVQRAGVEEVVETEADVDAIAATISMLGSLFSEPSSGVSKPSKKYDVGTFRMRASSYNLLAAILFEPISYFWICWNDRFNSFATSV